MKKQIKLIFTFSVFLLLFSAMQLHALDFSDISDTLADLGYFNSNTNEGATSFRSLLIPIGGRAESLGSAYTGLCDDAGYINYNSAASCILSDTQVSAFHNSWIAEKKI